MAPTKPGIAARVNNSSVVNLKPAALSCGATVLQMYQTQKDRVRAAVETIRFSLAIFLLKKQRGGTHNAPTHIHMKPTHMIGGYGQLSYGFNYYGPTGNQRDMTVVARKLKEVDWLED